MSILFPVLKEALWLKNGLKTANASLESLIAQPCELILNDRRSGHYDEKIVDYKALNRDQIKLSILQCVTFSLGARIQHFATVTYGLSGSSADKLVALTYGRKLSKESSQDTELYVSVLHEIANIYTASVFSAFQRARNLNMNVAEHIYDYEGAALEFALAQTMFQDSKPYLLNGQLHFGKSQEHEIELNLFLTRSMLENK